MRYPREEPPELLTVPEAARYLRVTARTLDRWRLRGVGPPSLKLPSGARRYRRADLDAWLREQREE
jgi:excisionase family DNA binding protein